MRAIWSTMLQIKQEIFRGSSRIPVLTIWSISMITGCYFSEWMLFQNKLCHSQQVRHGKVLSVNEYRVVEKSNSNNAVRKLQSYNRSVAQFLDRVTIVISNPNMFKLLSDLIALKPWHVKKLRVKMPEW